MAAYQMVKNDLCGRSNCQGTMSRVVPSQVVTYIEGAFAEIKRRPPNKPLTLHIDKVAAARLNGLVELIRQIPQELILLSGDDYSDFIANLGAIEVTLARWQNVDNSIALASLTRLPDGLSPVQILHSLLGKCPDAYPSPETAELRWIDDVGLRQNLRLDISSVNKALAEGEWKAATVLAGAVVEALLLWRFQRADGAKLQCTIDTLKTEGSIGNKISKDPRWWHLPDFIVVAAALSIITPETKAQAELGKEFRNLIHPGKEQRDSLRCDRATALSAVAGMEHVIRDLKEGEKGAGGASYGRVVV
ncbi:MAG: hypothetical protein HY205_01045 [Nitrospirae bacterium]|nr:hypothetical protein [Nitrospirota bacterium]